MENTLILGNGTKLSVIEVSKSGQKSGTNLIKGQNNCEFIALFDKEDIDFEIEVDNRLSPNGISFSIDFDQNKNCFYVKPEDYSTLGTLEDNGKKFHFKSVNTNDPNESIVCPKIKFKVEIEAQKVKPIGDQIIRLFIEINNSSNLVFIGMDNKVLDLMKFVSDFKGIPITKQRMCFEGKRLFRNNYIRDIGVIDGDSIEVSHEQTGGAIGDSNTDSSNALMIGSAKSNTQKSETQNSCDQSRSDSNANSIVGHKDLICFGDNSNQTFTDYNEFIPKMDLIIHPFTIELKMNSNCV